MFQTLTKIFDIPPITLIYELAQILKKDYEQVSSSGELTVLKAGVHRENPPQIEDWYYIRCASILRKLYKQNIIGINKLRNIYGGKKRRGPKPNKFKKGSGSIIRRALRQLEQAGLVEIIKGKGRTLSPSGRSLLDHTATRLKLKLQKEQYPNLDKY